MRRSLFRLFPLTFLSVLLAGCGPIGDKAASISVIYCITAVLSLLLLLAYCGMAKKRDIWYLLLFASVLLVNIGYFTLSISRGLDDQGEKAERYNKESEKFRSKWKKELEKGDPYYNPNFSLDRSDFSLKINA